MVKLLEAAELLSNGAVGSSRSEDRRAVALLAGLNGTASGSSEYWALVARGQLFAGEATDKVIESAERAASLCPRMAVARNLLGNGYLNAGQLELAQEAYAEALAAAPDYEGPRFNSALVALKQEDVPRALQLLDDLLRRNPQHVNAYLVRAQAQVVSGRFEAALEDLNVVLRRQPDNAAAYVLLGHARSRLGEADAARDAFCKAKSLGHPRAASLCDR